MKILVYYPAHGTRTTVEVSAKDEQRLYGKKIGEQFDGAAIGEQFAGFVMQLQGGNDYQGVCMVPGRDTTKRIRLLLAKGDVGYRARKSYVRKRKTVRGSIISSSIQVISVIIARAGERTIEGLTDVVVNKTHFPKKDSKIRAVLGVDESVDLRKHIDQLCDDNVLSQKARKVKITGVITEAEKARRAQKLALRQARTEKFNKEKAEYESKYGVIS